MKTYRVVIEVNGVEHSVQHVEADRMEEDSENFMFFRGERKVGIFRKLYVADYSMVTEV